MSELPDSTGSGETPDQRYDRCLRWYNTMADRYNASLDTLTATEADFRDAETWLSEARSELNRAAAVTGAERAA